MNWQAFVTDIAQPVSAIYQTIPTFVPLWFENNERLLL
jgi:hypothetical protein